MLNLHRCLWSLLLVASTYGNTEACEFLQIQSDVFTCGVIAVPENHSLTSSPKIELAYVVISSFDARKNSHPAIFLTGGPGGATLEKSFLLQLLDHPIRKTRDLILFDQRGINFSSALPNMSDDLFKIMAKNVHSAKEQLLVRDLIKKYRHKAKRKNIDLGSYNTYQSARDVGILMDHLGYSKYNLVGFSYGTRLARIIQELYPGHINSSIFVGPNPLGGDFLISRLQLYSAVLQSIFDSCNQQVECYRKYPQLEEDYIQAVTALKDHPIKVHLENGSGYVINPQDAMYWVRRALYSQEAEYLAPELIQAIKTRDPGPMREMIQDYWDSMDSFNSSMWISVERFEMFDPRVDVEDVDSAYRSLPLLPAKLGLFNSLYLEAREWHHAELPVDQRSYSNSHTPTLIFVNLLDPITPPADGKKMMRTLTNGTLLILDEQGHGGGNWECQLQVMIEFMDNPHDSLDLSCLNLYHR